MGGQVSGGGGVAERNYGESDRQLRLAQTELHNHSTARLTFPAGELYLAPKQGATRTP